MQLHIISGVQVQGSQSALIARVLSERLQALAAELGEATAHLYAQRGVARLSLIDRDADALEAVAQGCCDMGVHVDPPGEAVCNAIDAIGHAMIAGIRAEWKTLRRPSYPCGNSAAQKRLIRPRYCCPSSGAATSMSDRP